MGCTESKDLHDPAASPLHGTPPARDPKNNRKGKQPQDSTSSKNTAIVYPIHITPPSGHSSANDRSKEVVKTSQKGTQDLKEDQEQKNQKQQNQTCNHPPNTHSNMLHPNNLHADMLINNQTCISSEGDPSKCDPVEGTNRGHGQGESKHIKEELVVQTNVAPQQIIDQELKDASPTKLQENTEIKSTNHEIHSTENAQPEQRETIKNSLQNNDNESQKQIQTQNEEVILTNEKQIEKSNPEQPLKNNNSLKEETQIDETLEKSKEKSKQITFNTENNEKSDEDLNKQMKSLDGSSINDQQEIIKTNKLKLGKSTIFNDNLISTESIEAQSTAELDDYQQSYLDELLADCFAQVKFEAPLEHNYCSPEYRYDDPMEEVKKSVDFNKLLLNSHENSDDNQLNGTTADSSPTSHALNADSGSTPPVEKEEITLPQTQDSKQPIIIQKEERMALILNICKDTDEEKPTPSEQSPISDTKMMEKLMIRRKSQINDLAQTDEQPMRFLEVTRSSNRKRSLFLSTPSEESQNLQD